MSLIIHIIDKHGLRSDFNIGVVSTSSPEGVKTSSFLTQTALFSNDFNQTLFAPRNMAMSEFNTTRFK